MYLKYASIPRGIGAYCEANPLNGNVPPIVIARLVIPGTASGACVASVRANAPGRLTLSAAPSVRTANRTFLMCFSSLPFGLAPARPPPIRLRTTRLVVDRPYERQAYYEPLRWVTPLGCWLAPTAVARRREEKPSQRIVVR